MGPCQATGDSVPGMGMGHKPNTVDVSGAGASGVSLSNLGASNVSNSDLGGENDSGLSLDNSDA